MHDHARVHCPPNPTAPTQFVVDATVHARGNFTGLRWFNPLAGTVGLGSGLGDGGVMVFKEVTAGSAPALVV